MTVQKLLNRLFRIRSTSLRKRVRGFRAPQVSESLEVRSLLTSLIGAEVTVSATFQSNSVTAGQELPLAASARAVVEESASSDPEFEQYSNLYDIDVDGGLISMNYNFLTGSGADPARVIELGTFYRYYFDFEGLATNEIITSATAETTRNLIPNVTVVDSDTVLVEIGPGMELGTNFNALILVGVEELPRSIDGTDVTVSATTQSLLGTSGIEIPNGDPSVTTVVDGSGPELTSFSNIYDVNLESNQISMTFNLAAGAPDPSRVIEAGTFERYYFEFDLGTNESITSATANTGSTLVPNVSVTGGDTIVVEVGPGMQIGTGQNAQIDFVVDIVGSEVSGRKWNDLNNDGVRTIREPFLNGWEIQLQDLLGNVIDTTFTRNIDLNFDGLIDPSTEMGWYVFEGVQNGTYVVEEVMQQSWIQSHPVSPVEALASQLNRNLALQPTSNDFLNWGGLSEKWVFGAGGVWYFITPDGQFYQWDSSPRTALTGQFVGQLSTAVYNDTSLLYNAAVPVQNNAQVTVPTAVDNLDFGNYLAPPVFTVTQDHAANNVTFDWNEASSGSVYEIWITDTNTKKRHTVLTGVVGDTHTLNLPDRNYRAWMRTEYSPGVFSAWSASQEFEFLRAPIDPIVGGLDAGIDATPTIQWTAQTDAVSYDVRVMDSTGNVVYLERSVAGTQHRIATPLARASYQVAVRGNYSDGSRNEWSAGQTLVIDGRPVVQVNGNIVSWAPVAAANEYEIWVDRIDNDGNRLQRQVVYANDLKDTSFTLPSLFVGRYSVWVRAIRAEGGDEHFSFWSTQVNFLILSENDEEDDGLLEPLNQQIEIVSATEESTARPEEAADNRRVETAEVTTEEQANSHVRLVNAVMEEIANSDMLDKSRL